MPSALITGANRGIGLEFTKQYAAANWRLYACCRNPQKADALRELALQYPGMVSLHTLDINDFERVGLLASELSENSIDLLINNAGIYPQSDSKGFGATDYAAWAETFRINTMAPMRMVEAFAHHVANSDQKKIVNITSKMGSIDDNTSGGYYLYRTSKTALNMATKSLSIDLAPRGITAIVLHPGWVQTDMGGPNALITVQESVSGMRKVIDGLTLAKSGKFYAYDGKEIPW